MHTQRGRAELEEGERVYGNTEWMIWQQTHRQPSLRAQTLKGAQMFSVETKPSHSASA